MQLPNQFYRSREIDHIESIQNISEYCGTSLHTRALSPQRGKKETFCCLEQKCEQRHAATDCIWTTWEKIVIKGSYLNIILSSSCWSRWSGDASGRPQPAGTSSEQTLIAGRSAAGTTPEYCSRVRNAIETLRNVLNQNGQVGRRGAWRIMSACQGKTDC